MNYFDDLEDRQDQILCNEEFHKLNEVYELLKSYAAKDNVSVATKQNIEIINEYINTIKDDEDKLWTYTAGYCDITPREIQVIRMDFINHKALNTSLMILEDKLNNIANNIAHDKNIASNKPASSTQQQITTTSYDQNFTWQKIENGVCLDMKGTRVAASQMCFAEAFDQETEQGL